MTLTLDQLTELDGGQTRPPEPKTDNDIRDMVYAALVRIASSVTEEALEAFVQNAPELEFIDYDSDRVYYVRGHVDAADFLAACIKRGAGEGAGYNDRDLDVAVAEFLDRGGQLLYYYLRRIPAERWGWDFAWAAQLQSFPQRGAGKVTVYDPSDLTSCGMRTSPEEHTPFTEI